MISQYLIESDIVEQRNFLERIDSPQDPIVKRRVHARPSLGRHRKSGVNCMVLHVFFLAHPRRPRIMANRKGERAFPSTARFMRININT